MDTRQCASKDSRPDGGWIGGSYIDWRRERVAARTLGPEGGVDCEISHPLGGERSILYKGCGNLSLANAF